MGIVLAIIFSLARALHGGGYVSRIISVCIMASGYGAYLLATEHGMAVSGIGSLIAFASLLGGLVLGWGKGFAAITGSYNPAETEFWPADKLGDLVFNKWGNAKLAGAVFMTLRAVLFYPLFAAMAFYLDNYSLLLWGLSVSSMGLVYWLAGFAGEKHAVRIAEVVYFAIIGAALA
jgi:hypothetical protein